MIIGNKRESATVPINVYTEHRKVCVVLEMSSMIRALRFLSIILGAICHKKK